MKTDNQDDIQIVSELSHHYEPYDENSKFTESKAKALIAGFITALVLLMIGVNVYMKIYNNNLANRQAQLESQLEEERQRRVEILSQADELCLGRVADCTENGIVQIDQMMYEYKYQPTSDGWADDFGTVTFDFSDESHLIVRYKEADTGNVFISENTSDNTSVNNYYCKIGNQNVVFSNIDMTAFGRVLIGSTDGFTSE